LELNRQAKNILQVLTVVFVAILLLTVLTIPVAAVPKNLVVNGGFETPVTNWCDFFPTGTPGLGWTVDRVSGGPSPGLELQRGIFLPVVEGAQFAELNGSEVDTIFQNIATAPSATYRIRFAFSPRPWTTDFKNQISVEWDGKVVGTVGPAEVYSGSNTWTYYEYSVEAASRATELRFTGLDPLLYDTVGSFIDDVSVVETQPPTRHVSATSNLSLWILIMSLAGTMIYFGVRTVNRSNRR
jgi:hypothetical protein